jgi:hypothetical protein
MGDGEGGPGEWGRRGLGERVRYIGISWNEFKIQIQS